MSKENETPPSAPMDDFEASLKSIMERLRRQAEEIAQLRRELDKVRSSTTIATPAKGVSAVDLERAKDDSEGR